MHILNVLAKTKVPLPYGMDYEYGTTLNEQEEAIRHIYARPDMALRSGVSGQWKPIKKRNLVFHLYPHAERGGWLSHLNRLSHNIDQFNGKLVFGVAMDESCVSAKEVIDNLPEGSKIFFVMNDLRYREVTTIGRLLEEVQSDNPEEATFFAHTKGTTRPGDVNVATWVEMMYSTCLDDPDEVSSVLQKSPMAGTFLKVGYGFAPKSWSDWHYTGSFYWLRHVPHFARNWRAMDYEWFGAESYPSMVYCREDVRPIVARGPLPALDVYQDECMAQRVLPAYMHWRKTGEFVDYRDH